MVGALSLAALLLLAAPGCLAQTTGYMPDLGYAEPDWKKYQQGNPTDPVISEQTMDASRMIWGSNSPGSEAKGPLCVHSAGAENNGRGSCKTDFSWLAASLGVETSAFTDPFVNYFMRFQVFGACYRSTQYSYNNEARYCAQWWLDPITNKKINTTQVCYDIIQTAQGRVNLDGTPYRFKWGCAHLEPGTPPPVVDPDVIGAGAAVVGGRRLLQNGTAAPLAPAPTNDVTAGAAPANPPSDAPADAPKTCAGGQFTIATGADLKRSGKQLFAAGLEKWETRQQWYQCQDFTQPNTDARQTCYDEAIGLNYGLAAAKLRYLMEFYAGTRAGCNEWFASNGQAQQTAGASNKDWCETSNTNWMKTGVLAPLGLDGTPANPACMGPEITPPPPPSPPPPPPPPSPPSPPPLGVNVQNDTLDVGGVPGGDSAITETGNGAGSSSTTVAFAATLACVLSALFL